MMAALITGLRVKKETIGEITAAAQVMREFSTKVHVADTTHLVDIVGTGGDGSHTFNISTCSMFVAAAAGCQGQQARRAQRQQQKSAVPMCWRVWASTSTCRPRRLRAASTQVGIGFMFAPNHHPAMKNVAPVRRELGIKTIFNILGPADQPGGAPNILMGVFHPDLVGIQVRALQRLGTEHAVVVYGRDGMDEVSLGAATLVGELKNGRDHRVRNPSRRFRPGHGQQPRPQGGHARSVAGHVAGRAGQPARARRATSWRSMPAWRCMRPTSRTP
jgi:anthranilate phosphoribosyltransferase